MATQANIRLEPTTTDVRANFQHMLGKAVEGTWIQREMASSSSIVGVNNSLQEYFHENAFRIGGVHRSCSFVLPFGSWGWPRRPQDRHDIRWSTGSRKAL